MGWERRGDHSLISAAHISVHPRYDIERGGGRTCVFSNDNPLRDPHISKIGFRFNLSVFVQGDKHTHADRKHKEHERRKKERKMSEKEVKELSGKLHQTDHCDYTYNLIREIGLFSFAPKTRPS